MGDPRTLTTTLSPPPGYSDSVHSADFYDLYTATGSDNSSYSRGSMDNRRPPGPDRSAAQRLNIPPSSFHIHSDRHDRRYSDASDVLPIDIDHRQRSSSGSSGSPSHTGWDRDNYAATVNPAGLLTPPGSVLSSLPSPQSPLLVGPSRPQRQQSFQQLQVPCKCTFYELGNANMSLYPPGDVDNQTPLYSVHVSPSCFQPMSFVTTVKRGGINSKQLVARFELGISRDPPTLFMGDVPYQLNDVFHEFRKVKSKLKDRWLWERGNCKLHWYYSGEYEATCHFEADSDRTPLAKLISAVGAYLAPGSLPPQGTPRTLLMVMTPNQALLDEIVVSALLVERKRLTPIDGNQNKELFN